MSPTLRRMVAAGAVAVTLLVAGAVTAAATGRLDVSGPLAQARHDDGTTQAERNARTVVAFYTLAFNQHQPEAAVARFVGPVYIQHNPTVASGKAAFIQFVKGLNTQFPQARIDLRRVVAQDDLVVTHGRFTISPADRGSAVADIFRLERGKVVEHWDVIEAIPPTTVSGNPMV
jgi:predicted SnoaL-like aldol condensation-catalyzing enzyme